MGQRKQQVRRSAARAVVEPMECRRLMSASPEFVIGPDAGEQAGRHPASAKYERSLVSNDNGAWAFAYADAGKIKVNTSGSPGLADDFVIPGVGSTTDRKTGVTISHLSGVPQVDGNASRFVVSWGEAYNGNWAVKASVMDFPLGSSVRTATTFTVASGKGSGPKINSVALGGTNVAVSYLYYNTTGQQQSAFQRATQAGAKLGTPVTIPFLNTLDMHSDNSFVMAYDSGDANMDVLVQRYNADGTRRGPAPINLTNTPSEEERHSTVDTDAAGNFVVGIRENTPHTFQRTGSLNTFTYSDYNFVAQPLTANGTVGSPVKVVEGVPYHPITDTGNTFRWTQVTGTQALDVSPDGSFVASYVTTATTETVNGEDGTVQASNREYAVYSGRWDAAAQPASTKELLANSVRDQALDGTVTFSGTHPDTRLQADEIVSLSPTSYTASYWTTRFFNNSYGSGLRYGRDVLEEPLPESL